MRWVRPVAMTVVVLVASSCAHDGHRTPKPPGFDAPDAATQYAQARRAPLGPNVSVSRAYADASTRRDQMDRFASRIGRVLPYTPGRVSPTALLDAWTALGPGNIGGRTRVIRYHPTRHTTIFAAGVSGGIWRSDDDGGSWRATADGLSNLAINSLVIDPRQPDVMYAGTGEGYFREDVRGTGLPLRGSGIFVTRDGGSTWTRLASTLSDDFLWVNDLELGVSDSRRVYAATRTGVWRSSDSGGSWTQILATDVRGGCLDLAMRPDDQSDVLFAACGTYAQGSVYRIANASGGGTPEVVLREASMGRTSLAIAPSAPNTMYALTASNDAGPGGNFTQGLLAVYRSDRGGVAGSWQARVTNTDPTHLNTLLLANVSAASVEECGSTTQKNSYSNMGWYNNVIAVDPRDPERVWAAGVDWFRSDDGGRTWGLASHQLGAPESETGTHVDQHALTFHPDYDGTGNQIVIVGNDGGLQRTTNARAPALISPRAACTATTALQVQWRSLNHGYGVTQFYHGLAYPDGVRYVGGAQDNSTLMGDDQTGSGGWRSVIGGDGGFVAVNPTNPQIIYGETQWANLAKSTDGGARFVTAIAGLDPIRSDLYSSAANYLFVAPLLMDPADPNRLWVGGAFLYRTSNAATSWTKASTIMPDGGLISAIAIAPNDPNRVVAGTSKGDIVSSRAALTTTATTTWDVVRPRDGWVTSIAFDPKNPTILYATYGNFGGSHVYRSANGGGTWTPTDGGGARGLPDIPVHSIAVDPDDGTRLYLGTDTGVFVSVDGGASWLVEETGFGPAVTEWLTIVRDTSGRKRLFAFTHGRGVWRVDLK